MDIVDQLKLMTFDDYNPTKLQTKLEAIFKQPENFNVYQKALKHNCYLNTIDSAGLNANVNLRIEQDNETTLKQFVLTVKDRYQYHPDKLLHLELVITGQSIDNVTCVIRKNDMSYKNKDIIKIVKNCFGFYDNDYRLFNDYN